MVGRDQAPRPIKSDALPGIVDLKTLWRRIIGDERTLDLRALDLRYCRAVNAQAKMQIAYSNFILTQMKR